MDYFCKWCKEEIFETKPKVEITRAGDVVDCPKCGKFLYGRSLRGKMISRKGVVVVNIEHRSLLHDTERIVELGEEEVKKRLIPAIVYPSEIRKATKTKKKKTKYVRGKVKVTIDLINHPPHYLKGGIEAIDVIEAWNLPFHLANVVKYICRAGNKQGEHASNDLKKAKFYLDRHLEGKEK